jgi:hypothetical protein
MATGYRVQHKDPKMANALVTIPLMHRPIKLKPGRTISTCGACLVIHQVKTYHFSLDSEASTIISETILENLKKVPDMAGFRLTNEVKNPPTIKVGIDPERGRRGKRILLPDGKPAPHNKPRPRRVIS